MSACFSGPAMRYVCKPAFTQPYSEQKLPHSSLLILTILHLPIPPLRNNLYFQNPYKLLHIWKHKQSNAPVSFSKNDWPSWEYWILAVPSPWSRTLRSGLPGARWQCGAASLRHPVSIQHSHAHSQKPFYHHIDRYSILHLYIIQSVSLTESQASYTKQKQSWYNILYLWQLMPLMCMKTCKWFDCPSGSKRSA